MVDSEIIKKAGLPQAINKHSAAIHISGNELTLLQRKAFNILLANAYNELETKEKHTIRIWDILSCTGWHDAETLKKALVALSTTAVQWNILRKDDDREKGTSEWGVATLLAEAVITDDTVLTYAYSPTMRKKLFNPTIYARINLAMQKKFASKYSLALYELAVDYFIRARGKGRTGWIVLDDFKRILGCEYEKKYRSYGELNRHIIQKAINEINDKSDLQVTYETKLARGKGRKVIAVKFGISRNEYKTAYFDKMYGPKHKEPDLETQLAKRLRDEFLLSENQVVYALEMHSARIMDILDEVKKNNDAGLVENIGSYTWDKIKNNYIPPAR